MTVSEAVRKHKEFLFPAVATYYQEPIALVKGEGEYVWDDQGNVSGCVRRRADRQRRARKSEGERAIVEQVNKIQHTSTLYANPNSRIWRKSWRRSRRAI